MRSDYPKESQIPGLRRLWQEAFGDTDAFLDLFFSTGFSPDRCRCIEDGGRILAALYWFDCSCADHKLAYLYAVATAEAARGQGLCRKLMADTAEVLRASGYSGAILVPQDEGLFTMYGKMGYAPASGIREFFHAAAETGIPLRPIDALEYASARRKKLPPDSVLQECNNLPFFRELARFYTGSDFLAAVSREPDHLRILEYLGNPDKLGNLIAALGYSEATVRMPGEGIPFSMYLPLRAECPKPAYFAFPYD